MALQFLPYALAAYGGYRGYKASKDAGGSGLQRLLGGVTGAAAGYYGGKGILGGGSALGVPGFAQAQQTFTPFTQLGPIQSFAGTQAGQSLGLTQDTGLMGADTAGVTSQVPANRIAELQARGADTRNPLQKLLMRTRKDVPGEYEIDPMKAAFGVGALSYLSGAFENQPQDVYTPTYNLAVAELQKQRGGFKYIDPETGQEKVFAQPYIPEADPANKTDYQMGPYALAYNRFNTGGLAEIKKFNEGGINYLPSKRTHDEDDANNYVRASGYVEDGSGTGDKDEDTMLAQLADGEFVTRADGVLGAGIIAGANPNSMKDMREKGAQYFYEQQKRYKRVFDLLEGSRNAKAEAKVN